MPEDVSASLSMKISGRDLDINFDADLEERMIMLAFLIMTMADKLGKSDTEVWRSLKTMLALIRFDLDFHGSANLPNLKRVAKDLIK